MSHRKLGHVPPPAPVAAAVASTRSNSARTTSGSSVGSRHSSRSATSSRSAATPVSAAAAAGGAGGGAGAGVASAAAATASGHVVDEALLEPWSYILGVPGKNVRGTLIKCFQDWMAIDTDKLVAISTIVRDLHTASLLIDDIEDDSKLRRGIPVAHKVYGVPYCINAANYVYFMAMDKAQKLGNPEALQVFIDEMLNLHRGQGWDIMWRENLTCPTEAQYKRMVLDKTGGLFRLAVKLMQCFSNCTFDFMPLLEKLSLWFQIRDDYVNLASADYHAKKSFCEDLSEGKFSFLVIYAIHSNPGDNRLLNIIKQRTEDVDLKLYALSFLRESGAFDYTRQVLATLKKEALAEIAKLGGHDTLVYLIEKLDSQIEKSATSMSPTAKPHPTPSPPPAAELPGPPHTRNMAMRAKRTASGTDAYVDIPDTSSSAVATAAAAKAAAGAGASGGRAAAASANSSAAATSARASSRGAKATAVPPRRVPRVLDIPDSLRGTTPVDLMRSKSHDLSFDRSRIDSI